MSVHVERIVALIEQLRAISTTLEDSLSIGILVASIVVVELQLVTASIKTLTTADATWETVSNRLMDEANS